ncbi:hypothetical protein O181_003495 [Austropuccinia psidii MF-1]|uniref:Uncharacterized protein n=1 Tax=Austropuccinia psidii MF-1 TaxID=1389203 RepID=A0A9Q3GDZ0_9BASI|nr:hypothetical protein [Austropuccinia psidii MF-1]
MLPVDYLKKNLLTVHPTAKYFYSMWKKAFEYEEQFIKSSKEYDKRRYKSNKELDFKEGDQVLVPTLHFKNLTSPNNMREYYVGPLTIIKLLRNNVVEAKLTEEFSKKHPVFTVSLVKPYNQTYEEKFPKRKVVEEGSPGPVKGILIAWKFNINGKYNRQYLVRFKNQPEYKDKCLPEWDIPDGQIHLRRRE